jgi:serine/threonine-protein kinase
VGKPVQIEGYEILGLLGRGGMGDVYRAQQVASGRLCAIKVTRSDRTDEKSKARFKRESEAMRQVTHPHLIQLYDAGSVGDDLWIAIELIEGASLDRVLAVQGALSPELSCRLMLETCQALDAMHQQGLLHRDVKPANVMIEKDSGRAVLMDLGLAKDPTKTALTQTGHLLGTPVYLPREVFTGVSFDPSVDFYSVGISWWELLTGERPYDFTQMMDSLTKGTELTIPPPRSSHGEVPPRHLALIQAFLDERDLRPASWADVQAILEGRPMPVRPDRAPETGTRPLGATAPMGATEPLDASSPGAVSAGVPALAGSSAHRRSRLALAIPSVGLAIVGIAAMLWSSSSPSDTPGPDLPPTGSDTLAFVRTWADRHSVVVSGEAPAAALVRASRKVGGRDVPVPVYPVSETAFLVWVTGLEPGAAVEVVATDGAARVTTRGASVRAGEPSIGDRFPLPLRRFHPKDDAPILARQLESIREVVDTGVAIETELEITFDISLFRSFPDALWPAVLALLEREGPVVESLLRCLKHGQTPVPPEVAWHIAHRLADPGARLATVHHWDIGADYYEGCGVPLALPRFVEEWGEQGLATTSLFRLASFTAGRLGDAPKVKVFPGDLWGQEHRASEPVDPLPRLGRVGLAGLMAHAVRARRGDQAALDGLLEEALDPGQPLADWAMVLLGKAGDESMIEAILDEYAAAEGRREQAVQAALMGLRTVPGFWTPTDQPMLLRVVPNDLRGRVVSASVEGGHPVVWKPGNPMGFTLVPGKGAVLRLRLEGSGEQAYRLHAKGAPIPIE